MATMVALLLAATAAPAATHTVELQQLGTYASGAFAVGGAEIVVLRSDIAELKTLTTSIMPEGLESVLTAQDVADVLTFIGSKGA